MAWEIIVLAGIALFIFAYTGRINTNKFFQDNLDMFSKLMEKDYEFLLRVKYGDNMKVTVEEMFQRRIRDAVLVAGGFLLIFITQFSYIFVIIALILAFVIYKMPYTQLKSYYKRHLTQIDSLLPYYLKGLEILIQHYTVPVAIGKSVSDAPEIFKPGLQVMIDQINNGDQSIDPYMQFAHDYPVRDSMRMMRLLYRLSLGRQERKQEQLLTFSRSISSLQQKARETKYKKRLEKMESKTMAMLMVTGFGVMILLIVAVLQMMSM